MHNPANKKKQTNLSNNTDDVTGDIRAKIDPVLYFHFTRG